MIAYLKIKIKKKKSSWELNRTYLSYQINLNYTNFPSPRIKFQIFATEILSILYLMMTSEINFIGHWKESDPQQLKQKLKKNVLLYF